jgi:4-amino-4-deoxy-L-arabinose transferase
MAAFLLCALFVLLYLAFLGIRPLFIPDEVRYGEISREMIATGNWIAPRLNGLQYFEKPPFGHWMNAISLLLFGENPFAVRFASAFSAGGSAVLVFFMGRHLFESRTVPYLAAFVFLTTLEVQAVGTFSVLDSMFAFYLNAGIGLFAVAASASGKRQYGYLACSGVLFGIAFLTKGFLAFVLPVLALVPWLFLNRQFELLFRRSWVAVVVALLVIVPWSVSIHLQQPDFWHYFFWTENAQHKAPIYYYLMYLPFVAFPWIFLLPASIRVLRTRDDSTDRPRAILLLTSWALLPLLLFSVASGKLVTYILPCFVPFSLLIAVGLTELLTVRKAHRIAIPLIAVTFLIFATALIFVYVRPPTDVIFARDEIDKLVLLTGALCLALVALIYSFRTNSPIRRVLGIGLAMVPVLVALPLSLPDIVMRSKAPVSFLQNEFGDIPADTKLVTSGAFLRAVSWSFKRDDVLVIDGGGETTYGLAAADAKGRFLSPEMFGQLANSGAGVLLLCKKGCTPETMNKLPAAVTSSSYGNFTGYYIEPSTSVARPHDE